MRPELSDWYQLYVIVTVSHAAIICTHYIADLTQPVDVYSDWIDACDAVAKDQATTTTSMPAPSFRQRHASASAQGGLAPGEKYTDEDAGFIDDEGADAEVAYDDD